MSICRIVLQKLSIYSHVRPFSATFVLRVRRNSYLWTSGVNVDTAVRFPYPDYLLECKILAIWRYFPFFSFLYAACPPHFYFRFVWPADQESIPHASTFTSIIPTKFEFDMTIHCRVIAVLSADTSRNFVILTCDLLILNSCHTWRVTWPTMPTSLKTLRLSALELWVIYNVSRWLPLKIRTRSLRTHPNHVSRE